LTVVGAALYARTTQAALDGPGLTTRPFTQFRSHSPFPHWNAAVSEETDAILQNRCAHASALASDGRTEAAIVAWEAAWDLARTAGRADWRARCCQELADLHRRCGRTHLANQYRQHAIKADLDATGSVRPECWLRDRAAEAVLTGDIAAAGRWLRWLAASGVDDFSTAGAVLALIASLLRMSPSPDSASRIQSALQFLRRRRDFWGHVLFLAAQGLQLRHEGNWRDAERCFEAAAERLCQPAVHAASGARQEADREELARTLLDLAAQMLRLDALLGGAPECN
jgi:hypothetical protein